MPESSGESGGRLRGGCSGLFLSADQTAQAPDRSYFLWAAYLEQLLWLVYLTRVPGSRRSLDLGLFDTVSRSAQGNSYVAENVLLFLPFGVLFPLLFPFRRRRSFRFPACLLSAFLCSAGIETVQYLTARGYSQLDDVITNVTGAIIGYFICGLSRRTAEGGKK